MLKMNRGGLDMSAYFDEIIKRFPVRNSADEKKAFRDYVLEEAKRMGYASEISDNDKHKNIIIGNADTAKVIFTAHYDTPWRSPWPNLMLPKARGLFILYQIGMLIPFLLISFLSAFLVMKLVPLDYTQTLNRLVPLYAYLFTYYILFFLFIRGFKNPHNLNDNTSGVATVLEIAESIRPEMREKAAFILFDNEERGKKGSKAFSRAHKDIDLNTPVINFDCVGYGDHFVVIEKEGFKEKSEYNAFKNAFGLLKNVHFFSSKQAQANSDQTSFKLGNAVMATKQSKRGILYVDRIHTPKDTVVDIENLECLKKASVSFIESI